MYDIVWGKTSFYRHASNVTLPVKAFGECNLPTKLRYICPTSNSSSPTPVLFLGDLPPSIQCTLINFIATEKGLEDQLLAKVVGVERPELEKQAQELQSAFNQVNLAHQFGDTKHAIIPL